MNNRLTNAVGALIDVTTASNDYESVKSVVLEHKDLVTAALQLIGDSDHEDYITASHMALWKVCNPEIEEHVAACNSLYVTLIQQAWESFDQDMAKALDAWLEVKEEAEAEADPEQVKFLESCLDLTAQENSNGSWKF